MNLSSTKWTRKREAWLVRKAAQGNTRAFEILIQKYQRQIYACIARMIFSHYIIDDLIQETFIKAFKNLYRFDPEYPFYPWLRTIAINTTLNFLKSRKQQKSQPLEEFSGMEQCDFQSDLEQDLEQKELREHLDRALARLPVSQQAVFVLRAGEEMSYEEIAQTLSISIGTVMSRLNRARTRLKQLLQEFF
jgi:RNA polymerase sigma-70 factor, ECF subfamily